MRANGSRGVRFAFTSRLTWVTFLVGSLVGCGDDDGGDAATDVLVDSAQDTSSADASDTGGDVIVDSGNDVSDASEDADGEDTSAPPVIAPPLFGPDYPKAFFFRLEPFSGMDPVLWREEMTRLDGWIAKPLREELFSLHPMAAARLNEIAALPDQAALAHFNGRAIDPRAAPPTFTADRYLHFEGCDAVTMIAPGASTLCLPAECLSRYQVCNGRAPCQPDDLTIASRVAGAIDWSVHEEVTLTAVRTGPCPASGSGAPVTLLDVERARFGTIARSFSRAYVAAHVPGGPWGRVDAGDRLLWFFNYANGAGPLLADYLADEFREGGALAALDGIVIDIAPFLVDGPMGRGGRMVDGDGDGVGDGGRDDAGVNQYGLGVHDFYRQLRRQLPDKVLVADGGQPDSQRSLAFLNGMEAEGIGGPNDPKFTAWGTGVNRLVYWMDHAAEPRFNYVAHKGDPVVGEVRAVLGAATAIGAGVTSVVRTRDTFDVCEPSEYESINRGVFDELVGGELDTRRWLGAPVAPLRRPGLSAEDELSGAGVTMTDAFVSRFSSEDADVRRAVAAPTLVVTSTSRSEDAMTFTLNDVPMAAGRDFIFSFLARADPLEGFPGDVPRDISVTIRGASLPIRDGESLQAETLHALVGADFSEQVFYFRNARAATVDLEIRVEGEAALRIREFRVRHATDGLVREFENGMVIVNPSVHRGLSVDLGTGSFRHLTGTRCQDMTTNDGSPVTGAVNVPATDAWFLIRDE